MCAATDGAVLANKVFIYLDLYSCILWILSLRSNFAEFAFSIPAKTMCMRKHVLVLSIPASCLTSKNLRGCLWKWLAFLRIVEGFFFLHQVNSCSHLIGKIWMSMGTPSVLGNLFLSLWRKWYECLQYLHLSGWSSEYQHILQRSVKCFFWLQC